jgi:hypothetical protein
MNRSRNISLRQVFVPSHWVTPLLAALVLSWAALGSASAQTTFGSLSNFDVFNDTGQECHGFEIELDGISSTDIIATFGSPYQRYGNPQVVSFPGGVYVRYESSYDAGAQTFTQTTPLAPSVITPTGGHACWTGGSANYLTSGCEHFGVGLTGNPTNTVYRWLIADLATPGALQPSGTKVSIPAPIWSVAPAPQPGAPPVVRAVLPAEPPEVHQEYGDAHWVKVFVTESQEPIELHHLLTDDPVVPQEASETETEWVLLQSGPKGKNELANEAQVGAGHESVTRRYELYEYTGAYDSENHEALPVNESTPDPADIGNYIGAQMAAINLAPIGPTPTPTEPPIGSPTPTASPTPPVVSSCVGDCEGSGTVTVDELLVMVNIALNSTAVAACTAGDADANGEITIDEILTAVNNALGSCPTS